MNYAELKQAVRIFLPALLLEDAFPRRGRRRTAIIANALVALAGSAALVLFASSFLQELPERLSGVFDVLDSARAYANAAYGLLFVFLSLRITLGLLESFYRSYYFRGLDMVLAEHAPRGGEECASFEISSIVRHTPEDDVTRGFFASPYGSRVAARIELGGGEVGRFLAGRKLVLGASELRVDAPACATLTEYAQALFRADKELVQFLFSREVQEKDFVGAAEWVERENRTARKKERWWSRDRLGRLPGIGKSWSYGQVYILKRYGRNIEELPVYRAAKTQAAYGAEELEALEAALARSSEANAILVGEEGIGKMEVVARLARLVSRGSVLPPLEHKEVYVLDGDALIAAKKEKGAFEEEFIRLMNQAVEAGNIILVFENFPSFLESARTVGSDVVGILDPYLSSSGIQVIATSDPDRFHGMLEPNTLLMRRFNTIHMSGAEGGAVIRILEDTAGELEGKHGAFFTYPSLTALAEGAERYIPSGVMPDKAVNLMIDCLPAAALSGDGVITRRLVLDVIGGKTHIPLGEVGEEEKGMLLKLEETLHRRVIGQDEAVSAVAGAMRRARTGIRDPERPMGSFLFLGPTGVGKTQTAKTLAAIFFGSEERMMRLDMSEYHTDDALDRLLGSFESGKAGTFTSLLREKPYGVLLLDEFEKTTPEVHNLFLRILDEGEFSDMRGKKVNAQNLIIIATSNAGSGRIWELFKEGKNVSAYKDDLVGMIIRQGTFKPELLNRFDGVIVFHPLAEEHLARIARILLEELKERLAERGIDLAITHPLVRMLVREGYDPEFGARPMNRAIQEKVEQEIAEAMIRGEIKAGMKVVFDGDKFAPKA